MTLESWLAAAAESPGLTTPCLVSLLSHAVRNRADMSQKLKWTLVAVVSIWAVALFVLLAKPKPAVVRNTPVTERIPTQISSRPSPAKTIEATPTVSRSDGYLGSDSCQECHQDYHQSWHESYHRTMTQSVNPESVPASIVDGGLIEVNGESFRFLREGDDYFVELDDPIAGGRHLKRRLVLVTGSHHMQVFWYESGYDKTPAQLQIMYYIDGDRWIPRRSAFLRPPSMEKEHELGRWNSICSNCHSTQPRTRPPQRGEVAWDTRVAEFGITCEACHGPGEAHVEGHRLRAADPQLADFDDPIVNPAGLPTDLKSDMCGQCHGMMMISIADVEQREKYFEQGRQFRPGDQIEDAPFLQLVRASKEHRDTKAFREFDSHHGVMAGHFWPDGQLRVTGRDYSGMIESKCFQDGDLSCMSCHTMHQQDKTLQHEWKDDQLKPNMRTDRACLQCHPKYEAFGSSHTHHPVSSEGSRCMNCHMPHTIYGILKSSRSHTISSPSVTTTLETGRPNACNLCHLDHTLEQTAKHLATWYDQPIPELTGHQKTTAASILQFLTGDAAQRALQVNAFQWKPAQEASGTDWLTLFLLLGMDDEYDAIRLIAERGYHTLPNATQFDYDFLQPMQRRGAVMGPQYMNVLRKKQKPNSALLIDQDGFFDRRRMEALMSRRDHTPIYLQE